MPEAGTVNLNPASPLDRRLERLTDQIGIRLRIKEAVSDRAKPLANIEMADHIVIAEFCHFNQLPKVGRIQFILGMALRVTLMSDIPPIDHMDGPNDEIDRILL